MTAFVMRSKMFLILALLIGIETEANTMDRCLEMVNFEGKFGSIIELDQDEQLGLICTNMSSFFECTNNVMKAETTYNFSEIVNNMKSSSSGKGPVMLIATEELVKDICVDGSAILKAYKMNKQCFQKVHNESMSHCMNQARGVYKVFKEVRADEEKEIGGLCVITASHVGCLGAAVKEKCGEYSFRIYIKVVWQLGFFKCAMHGTNFTHLLKYSYKSRATVPYMTASIYPNL